MKDISLRFTLTIGFHHHSDHVKADENNDGNIEGLVCNDVKKEPLESVLEETTYIRHQLGKQGVLIRTGFQDLQFLCCKVT